MSTNRSGSWIHPGGSILCNSETCSTTAAARAGQRRPLGQQLDAARPPEVHQRGPKKPRCRGGRGSISGGSSRLR